MTGIQYLDPRGMGYTVATTQRLSSGYILRSFTRTGKCALYDRDDQLIAVAAEAALRTAHARMLRGTALEVTLRSMR